MSDLFIDHYSTVYIRYLLLFQCFRFKKFEQIEKAKETLLSARLRNAEAVKWMKENKVVIAIIVAFMSSLQ